MSEPQAPLTPGTKAPDFELQSAPDQTVSLGELRGRPVILAFYPADWSPVCGDQMALYNEMLPEFQRLDAELLGISVDGVWCHLAFAQDRKLHFPLLADFEPKGEVARAYGVYRAAGRHQRAGAVRHRRRRRHPLELRLAGRRQSRRRRDPRTRSKPCRRRTHHEHDSGSPALTLPVSDATTSRARRTRR